MEDWTLKRGVKVQGNCSARWLGIRDCRAGIGAAEEDQHRLALGGMGLSASGRVLALE